MGSGNSFPPKNILFQVEELIDLIDSYSKLPENSGPHGLLMFFWGKMTPRKPGELRCFFVGRGQGVLGESDKGALEQNMNASIDKIH